MGKKFRKAIYVASYALYNVEKKKLADDVTATKRY